jgi:hypothetical protein
VKDGSILPNVVSWRERNYWSFEDRKRTVVELKAFFFQTLTTWQLPLTLIFLVLHVLLNFFLFWVSASLVCFLIPLNVITWLIYPR